MDIQLKKKPWYVKYFPYILTGAIIVAFSAYTLIQALGPRHLKIELDDYMVSEARETPFLEYIDVEGLVLPISTIQVNSLEHGFVEKIVAEEGSMVEAGDTIIVLSNVELLRMIEDEEADWQNRQRDYREQEIEMDQRSINLRQQALETDHQMASLDKSLTQSREEFRMGIKSKAELEVVEEDYSYQHRKAELQMQSLRQDSVAMNLRREMILANREASLRKLSRSRGRSGNLIIRAPVSGQLSFLNVTLGQQVASGSSVCEIKVLSEYKIRVSLSEYYIDRIITGLPANIEHQDEKYPLRISKVSPEVKERSFNCDLLFTSDKPSNIRLGKSYRVQIELAGPEPALVIKRGDFYKATSGHWIYRISPDGKTARKTARKTDIEIGRQNPRQYEIISGLKPGDRVIVSGYDKYGDSEELILR